MAPHRPGRSWPRSLPADQASAEPGVPGGHPGFAPSPRQAPGQTCPSTPQQGRHGAGRRRRRRLGAWCRRLLPWEHGGCGARLPRAHRLCGLSRGYLSQKLFCSLHEERDRNNPPSKQPLEKDAASREFFPCASRLLWLQGWKMGTFPSLFLPPLIQNSCSASRDVWLLVLRLLHTH